MSTYPRDVVFDEIVFPFAAYNVSSQQPLTEQALLPTLLSSTPSVPDQHDDRTVCVSLPNVTNHVPHSSCDGDSMLPILNLDGVSQVASGSQQAASVPDVIQCPADTLAPTPDLPQWILNH
jgi:hypothetical protein